MNTVQTIPNWRTIGTKLQECKTLEEAMIVSGLDWDVIEKPLYLAEDVPVTSHKAIVNSLNNDVLGVVGSGYHPLQNIEAFRFFDNILESGAAVLEVAGSFRGGKRVWVQAKLNNSTQDVVKNDPVESYLCLYNAHDGSLAVGIMFTPKRLVCANMLQLAIEAAEKQQLRNVRIRHTSGMEEALKVTKQAIDVSRKTFDFTVEQYKLIQRKQLPIDGVRNYVREIFEVEKEDKDPRCVSIIEENHETGRGSDIVGVRGTYWGAFNAFTEWLDHQRGKSEEKRLDSSMFGNSSKLRHKAFDIALAKASGLDSHQFSGTVQ